MTVKTLMIFTDGGASGNPGPAAIGVIIKSKTNEEKIIHQLSKPIGQATNNIAEYTAVIEALKWLAANGEWQAAKIIFYLDSKLLVNQLNGVFRIKNYQLRNLAIKIRQLEKAIGAHFTYQHIRRELNREADALVKKALVQS